MDKKSKITIGVIVIALIVLFSLGKTNQPLKKITEIDSLRAVYKDSIVHIISTHKSELESLKTASDTRLTSLKNSMREMYSKNVEIKKETDKYKSLYNNSKNQFVYILDGSVEFGDFKANGKKIVYKKNELKEMMTEYDRSKYLEKEITSLEKIVENYKRDSVVLVSEISFKTSTIDSISHELSYKDSIIESYSKKETIVNLSKYSLSASIDGVYNVERGMGNRFQLDAKKYIGEVPLIGSRIYLYLGYENENVIEYLIGHQVSGGLGLEL